MDRICHSDSLFLRLTNSVANLRAHNVVKGGTLAGRMCRIEDAAEEGTSRSIEESSASFDAPKAGKLRCRLDDREDMQI